MLGSCSAERGHLLSAPLPLGLWGYWSESRADFSPMALVPDAKLSLLVKLGASLPPCMCATKGEACWQGTDVCEPGRGSQGPCLSTATDEGG